MESWWLRIERWVRRLPRASGPVRRVLVLEHRLPLGCCVHLTPVFEALHRCGVEVTVATRGLGTEVLRHSPFIDHLIATPDPLTDLPASVRALRRELRRRGIAPQCVLTGASDQRTRIALLGLLAAKGWRAGYTLKPRLYHRPLAYDAEKSLIANNLRLAELAGCALKVDRPRVFFSPDDLAQAQQLLRDANPASLPVVAMVTQTSGGQRTGWHPDRWRQVIEATEASGRAVLYVGTPQDAASIAAIAQGRGASLAGRTTIAQLAALLANCDAVVTLDTGTMHVGRAVGVPMVVLGPSWQRPLEWMPLGVENVRILRGEDRDEVPADYRLDEIAPESVVAALEELLALYPASPESRQQRARAALSEVDHLASAPT